MFVQDSQDRHVHRKLQSGCKLANYSSVYPFGAVLGDILQGWDELIFVSRSSGLAKTILQGTVKGGRRQGGQRMRWEDNIKEWTGLEFGKSQRAVENKETWRKLVAKSSVVPKRPSRLRVDDDDDDELILCVGRHRKPVSH